MNNNRDKFRLFLTGLCIGALIVAAIFAGLQRRLGREDLIQYTAMRTKELSVIVKPSLLFKDRTATFTILDSLKLNRSIVFSGVYDKEGNLFASYYRKDVRPQSIKQTKIPETGIYFSDGYLKVYEPIVQDNEVVGKVCIWTERQLRF